MAEGQDFRVVWWLWSYNCSEQHLDCHSIMHVLIVFSKSSDLWCMVMCVLQRENG